MLRVNFYDRVDDALLKFAVIACVYNGAWVFCKQKEKNTYEIPGGHREPEEDILTAAIRELYEETGAKKFDIRPVCAYSVTDGAYHSEETYGMLYSAEITSFQELPEFEMERVVLFPDLPEELTYPQIQPELFRKAKSVLEAQRDS